jgi:hypothetical protein
MADGTFETIRNVYEAEYIEDQEVYNIDVEGGLILADGFLSGEFGTQNDLSILEKNSVFAEYGVCKEQKQKQSVFSEEANSVVEEFVELLHEKYGVCTAPSAVPGRKCK